MRLRKTLTLGGVGAAAVTLVAGSLMRLAAFAAPEAGAERAARGEDAQPLPALPPLDLAIPAHLQTATFAFG